VIGDEFVGRTNTEFDVQYCIVSCIPTFVFFLKSMIFCLVKIRWGPLPGFREGVVEISRGTNGVSGV